MNKLIKMSALAMLGAAASWAAYADSYTLDGDASSVSFATIKKTYVVEPASMNAMEGQLDENGAFSITIPLSAIDTGIPIRDERLNALFFNAASFPAITVEGNVSMDGLKETGQALGKTVNAKVTLHGKQMEMVMNMNALMMGDTLVAYTDKPVIVSGSAFGIPTENLTSLAATVGDIAISDTVPVNLTLVFKKQ